MKILLIGEASFLHNTLKKGLVERGHRVLTMSDGNGWHDAPRDIDLRRNLRWGKFGGLWVVWQLLRHLPQLCGNDVVQIHNYQFVPLMYRWNTLLLRFLKLTNRCVVKGCFGDDPQIFRRQAQGVPAYSDTYWSGQLQNTDQHRDRIAEVVEHGAEASWRKTTAMADALVPCLYEYWLDYNEPPYAAKLHYIPLPIECEEMVRWCDGEMVKFVGNVNTSPSHPNDSQLSTLNSQFLFEPNASIMKAGCFAELSQAYGVEAIGPNSHLFVSSGRVEQFPGREFAIEAVCTLNKRQLKQTLGTLKQANIAVRNFPMSVAELRKRLKLRDGGDTYIFATTTREGEHVLIICRK